MYQGFAEVKNDFYCDEDGFWRIDAWKTDDDNEEGEVVAYVHGRTGDVVFDNPVARMDPLVQEAIEKLQEMIRNEHRQRVLQAEKCLRDNGIEPDEVQTVLQALGYILMDTELYQEGSPAVAKQIEESSTSTDEGEREGVLSVDWKRLSGNAYDIWIAHEGASGCHYTGISLDEVGHQVADYVSCMVDAVS